MFEDIAKRVVIIFFSVVAVFVLYMLFAIFPVVLYTQAECLEKGYPEVKVTVGLSRYCMNLDGSVTVRVDKQ